MLSLFIRECRSAGPTRAKVGLTAACVLALLAGSASAQSSPSSQPGQPADDAVLRGPRVSDNSHPGERNAFGGSKQRGQGAAGQQRPIPQPVFMKAVMALNADGAAAETRVSDDQLAQLKTIDEEFRTSQREFARQHRDEIRDLTTQLPPEDRARVRELLAGQGLGAGDRKATNAVTGKPGKPGKPSRPATKSPASADKPAPSDEMKAPADPMQADKPDAPPADPQQVEQARDKLRVLMEQAPKMDKARGQMWAVLSDLQRKAVETELTKVRQEMQARQIEESKKKKAAGGANDANPKTNAPATRPNAGKPDPVNPDTKPDGTKPDKAKRGPGAGKPPIAINDSQIRGKARERLRNLPPDQREEAIQKIKERRAAAPGKDKAKDKRKAPASGQKPPPPVDDVNVPKPDDDSDPK